MTKFGELTFGEMTTVGEMIIRRTDRTPSEVKQQARDHYTEAILAQSGG